MKSETDYRRWHVVSGYQLEDAINRGQPLSDYVLDCQAVYLWRRSLRAPSEVTLDRTAFLSWMNRIFDVPFGLVEKKRISHCVELIGLLIKPAELTKEKRVEFEQLSRKQGFRKSIVRYMEDLAAFSPPLYCGETGHLANRLRDHLSGSSGFGSKVSDSGVLVWPDLDLHYYAIDRPAESPENDAPRRRRELLELIATSMTISGYVKRRG